MAWTTISNALVAVGALPFATTIQALRDNPIAIANGDVGAPRIQTAAIQDGAVTAAKLAAGAGEVSWVAARSISIGVGGVGSYAFLQSVSASTINTGGTLSASDLRYANADGLSGVTGLSGTWRLHGGGVVGGSSTASPASTSLWQRIA